MKTLKVLVFAFLFASCAPINVNYDYDKSTDFTSYKTYNYYADMQIGLSELDSKRLVDVLDANMKTKGYSLSDNPDFLINIQSSEYQEVQNSSVGVGVGGGGGNVGGGISMTIPVGQANVNRRIVIDFVDENKKGLFWQAISDSSFSPNATPEVREEKLNAIVTKVLSQYPPQQK